MLLKKVIRFSVFFVATFPLTINAQNQAPAVARQVPADSIRTDAFLVDLFKQYPQYFDSMANKLKNCNVQLIYTSIDRGANGIASLKHYYFNVNTSRYFYPSSAVKLPLAMLTLQKLNGLKINGIDRNTTMLTDKAYSGQTAVYNDPTTPNGKPSIAQYMKKMLIVGDDDACNRLYEFLGQQYINEQLQQKGYTRIQVTERLNAGLNEDENRHTNPVKFLAPGNMVLYQQPMLYNKNAFIVQNDSLGEEDFFKKSRMSLEDLHTMLVSLVFPNKVTSSQRFDINDDDRKYILKYLSELPSESSNPPYKDDTATYHPAYSKYLLYGSGNDTLPKNIRIFNIVGDGHDQLVDAAYIVDFDKKIEFFLSAVIDCSSDSSLTEDKYESVASSFMKQLGEIIYGYETKREKKILPDLGEVKFEYDGR